MSVRYADPEPNGLASMVGGLIESNLARHPVRRSLLRPARVALTAPDADVSVTVDLGEEGITVSNGVDAGGVHVRVVADSRVLLDLAASPLRLGLPDPLHAEGRRVIRQLLSGGLRVEGMLRHPRKLTRLARLLSVA